VKEIGMCSREARHLAISIIIVICAHIACDRGMGPSPLGYAGEWTGTTSQGTPIRFSVSAADTVTSFTLAYNFSADCSGTLTYTQLALPIHTLNPPGPPPYDQPGFGYSTSSDDAASGTLIAGHFSSDRRSASGQFSLVYYGACGTVVGRWNATRR
jgi:hypothetical protein